MRILLLDDDNNLLESIRRTLQMQGHEVDCANNAPLAVEMIETGGYDFALVDYMMPEKNGLWFLQNARIPRSTKVLIMTAHANRQVINEVFKHGVRGYLVKPFNDDELRTHIEFHSKQTSQPMETVSWFTGSS